MDGGGGAIGAYYSRKITIQSKGLWKISATVRFSHIFCPHFWHIDTNQMIQSTLLPIDRIEKSIEDSSLDILPLAAKKDLIKNLKDTSIRFRELCIGYDEETYKFELRLYQTLFIISF